METGGVGYPGGTQTEPEEAEGEIGVLVVGVEIFIEKREIFQSHRLESRCTVESGGGRDTEAILDFSVSVFGGRPSLNLIGEPENIEVEAPSIDRRRFLRVDDGSLDRGQVVPAFHRPDQGFEPDWRGFGVVVEEGDQRRVGGNFCEASIDRGREAQSSVVADHGDLGVGKGRGGTSRQHDDDRLGSQPLP